MDRCLRVEWLILRKYIYIYSANDDELVEI